jgi:hypothetical protein
MSSDTVALSNQVKDLRRALEASSRQLIAVNKSLQKIASHLEEFAQLQKDERERRNKLLEDLNLKPIAESTEYDPEEGREHT